jgi:hypothetical protein
MAIASLLPAKLVATGIQKDSKGVKVAGSLPGESAQMAPQK